MISAMKWKQFILCNMAWKIIKWTFDTRIITENQKKVYDILSSNGSLSLQQVADEIGLSLAGVKKICQKLQDYKILERSGSKKDGIWVIK